MDESGLPNRIVLFNDNASKAYRTRRLVFLSVLILGLLSIIWPIYPLFGDIRPFILGLPLSFAWPIIWLVIIFLALLFLYRTDRG
jgi:hypothetical protein